MVFKKKLVLFLFCSFFIAACGQKAATVNVETVVSQDVEIVQGNGEQAEDEEQKPDDFIGIYVLKIDSRYSYCNFVARIIHYLCSN